MRFEIIARAAIEIADEDSRNIIDCYGVAICDKAGRRLWHEVNISASLEGWLIDRALRYLALRGLLKRNPKNANQVKVLEGPR